MSYNLEYFLKISKVEISILKRNTYVYVQIYVNLLWKCNIPTSLIEMNLSTEYLSQTWSLVLYLALEKYVIKYNEIVLNRYRRNNDSTLMTF